MRHAPSAILFSFLLGFPRIKLEALLQYTTWSVETQAKKKIELLKEHDGTDRKRRRNQYLQVYRRDKEGGSAGRLSLCGTAGRLSL